MDAGGPSGCAEGGDGISISGSGAVGSAGGSYETGSCKGGEMGDGGSGGAWPSKYPCGAVGGALGSTSSSSAGGCAMDAGVCGSETPAESLLSSRSGTSSKVTGLGPSPSPGEVNCCASGSAGSTAGCSSRSSSFGFDSFGSLPSLMALYIRAAFHFAYLIFCRFSGSGVPQMWTRLKKVAAASKVPAVCLEALRIRHRDHHRY